jgi:prepilin-type processing-associated H-X9-DG protein
MEVLSPHSDPSFPYFTLPYFTLLSRGNIMARYSGGVNACLADGSVRFVSETTAFETLAALCTPMTANPQAHSKSTYRPLLIRIHFTFHHQPISPSTQEHFQ